MQRANKVLCPRSLTLPKMAELGLKSLVLLGLAVITLATFPKEFKTHDPFLTVKFP